MNHLAAFKSKIDLISKYGINKAHLIWVMGLYLNAPDLDELGSECITDDSDDKKIDFIRLDADSKKLVFAQGYYSDRKVDSAPANKASDLNTAVAWLLSGDIKDIPSPLDEIVKSCRDALSKDEIEQIDLLYVHNLSESVAVLKELRTVADHLSTALPQDSNITVVPKELGIKETESIYAEQSSQITVKDPIECPAELKYEERGPNWSSGILTVPGPWLKDLFLKYGEKLFSANYRGFLGVSKRKKINLGIKSTAEKQPDNFWAYNNGITILTQDFTANNKTKTTTLTGISIINGAQTTGSIGSLDSTTDLSKVNVLTRVIQCKDPQTIEEIIKYNNTQNKITTWDKFSNDPIQKTIEKEFADLGRTYNLKRGFSDQGEVGLENVAQALIALQGNYKEANTGKNSIFESDTLYKAAFNDAKARHILFAYCLSRSVDEKRIELKGKKAAGTIIALEEKQLVLLTNLRFKYFFLSLFGKCLETILSRKVTLKLVGFSPNLAKDPKKVINELILDLMPMVTMVLTYSATVINGKDLADVFNEDNSVETIGEKTSSILYATLAGGSTPQVEAFRKIVTAD